MAANGRAPLTFHDPTESFHYSAAASDSKEPPSHTRQRIRSPHGPRSPSAPQAGALPVSFKTAREALEHGRELHLKAQERQKRREERERSVDAEMQAAMQGIAANKSSEGMLRRRLVRELASCVARIFPRPVATAIAEVASAPASESNPSATPSPSPSVISSSVDFTIIPWWQAPLSPWATAEVLGDCGFLPRMPRLTQVQASSSVVRAALSAAATLQSTTAAAPISPNTNASASHAERSGSLEADKEQEHAGTATLAATPITPTLPWDTAAAAGDWAADHPPSYAPYQSEAAADSMRWLVRVWGTLIGVSSDAGSGQDSGAHPTVPGSLPCVYSRFFRV